MLRLQLEIVEQGYERVKHAEFTQHTGAAISFAGRPVAVYDSSSFLLSRHK